MEKPNETSEITSENQEYMREDNDNYCPRQDAKVLILGGTCFCKNRGRVCSGCIFDSEPIRVKLIWIMSEILQESGKEEMKKMRGKVAGESLGSLTLRLPKSGEGLWERRKPLRPRPTPKATFRIFGRIKL